MWFTQQSDSIARKGQWRGRFDGDEGLKEAPGMRTKGLCTLFLEDRIAASAKLPTSLKMAANFCSLHNRDVCLSKTLLSSRLGFPGHEN